MTNFRQKAEECYATFKETCDPAEAAAANAYNEAADEIERLVRHCLALRKNFARYLASAYHSDPAAIAALCDEKLDQSGELLGYVREAAK